jgi:hypothetical protein
MTYEVWYRAGHSLHWWKLPTAYTVDGVAEDVAEAVQTALKQVGFPFAQAEVRLVQQDKTSESEVAELWGDALTRVLKADS